MGQSDSGDPVTDLVNRLRNEGWHAPRTERNRPTLMARLSAGLLLADSEDMAGRKLFELARAKLVAGAHGGKTLLGEKGREIDGWIGTLALAIAARQLGEESLLKELAKSIAPRSYLGMQGAVEPAFWLLAASAYGVFGIEPAGSAMASVAGKSHPLQFREGVATLALPKSGGTVLIKTQRPVLVRVEARYVRPVVKTKASALSAQIQGEVGYSGDTAALEVLIRNGSGKAVERPVVEIELPSAASLSPAALETMAATEGILRIVPPDLAGVLRIYLSALGAKQDRRFALPILWIGEGKVSGLSSTVFDASTPWLISSNPGRTIELKAAPVETWE